MKDYVNKMIKEQQELYEKRMRLHVFIGSPEFEALPQKKKNLMRLQEDAMNLYYYLLSERIDLEDVNDSRC